MGGWPGGELLETGFCSRAGGLPKFFHRSGPGLLRQQSPVVQGLGPWGDAGRLQGRPIDRRKQRHLAFELVLPERSENLERLACQIPDVGRFAETETGKALRGDSLNSETVFDEGIPGDRRRFVTSVPEHGLGSCFTNQFRQGLQTRGSHPAQEQREAMVPGLPGEVCQGMVQPPLGCSSGSPGSFFLGGMEVDEDWSPTFLDGVSQRSVVGQTKILTEPNEANRRGRGIHDSGESVGLQHLQIHKFQGRSVGRFQNDLGCFAGFMGFDPPFHAEAPAVPRGQAWELILWNGGGKVVPHLLGKFQELFRHHGTNRMNALVPSACVAEAIPEIPGHGIHATCGKSCAQNVERAKRNVLWHSESNRGFLPLGKRTVRGELETETGKTAESHSPGMKKPERKSRAGFLEGPRQGRGGCARIKI